MQEKFIYENGIKTNYTITSSGIVYSLNYNKTGKKKALKQVPDKDGYLKVYLHVNGKIYSRSVARLVAIAFIPNDDPENKIQVNHKDGRKKTFNDVSNLEWATPKENIIHAYKTGLANGYKGEKSHTCKYKEIKIKSICRQIEMNRLTFNEICKRYKVPRTLVESIYYRRTWRHISENYNFENFTKIKKISESTVHAICKDIENGLDKYDICKKFNVPFHIVKSIYYKQTWKHISKDYNF